MDITDIDEDKVVLKVNWFKPKYQANNSTEFTYMVKNYEGAF